MKKVYRTKHFMHAGINAQYNYYIRTLNSKQKDNLYKTIDEDSLIQYSYLIKRKEYTDIIKCLNKHIGEKILQGKRFNIGRCGDLFIVGNRRNVQVDSSGKLDKKNMGIDWGKTQKLWEQEYPNVEKKYSHGINISYKHIHDKPIVYYDNKYEYKLNWYPNQSKTRPTGQKYYIMIVNDSFKTEIRKAIGDTEGTHIAHAMYDLKDYMNPEKNPHIRRMLKLN